MKGEEILRQRVVTELRDQGFDVPPQLQLPQRGFWFKGKFFSFDEVDTSKWGKPPTQGRHDLFSEKFYELENALTLW